MLHRILGKCLQIVHKEFAKKLDILALYCAKTAAAWGKGVAQLWTFQCFFVNNLWTVCKDLKMQVE